MCRRFYRAGWPFATVDAADTCRFAPYSLVWNNTDQLDTWGQNMKQSSIVRRSRNLAGHISTVLIALLLADLVAAEPGTQGEIPAGYDRQKEGQGLLFLWREAETDESTAETAIEVGNVIFNGIAKFLGRDRVPSKKLVVVLDGSMFANGTRRIPRVDAQGRVLLYTTSAPMNQYMSVFAHELVHAIRYQNHLAGDASAVLGTGFFEEGFAEAVALQVEGHSDRYPYWGYSPAAINAHLIEEDLAIPLERLINEHAALSLKCELQSYPLRGSFLTYLHSLMGHESFLLLSDARSRKDTSFYEKRLAKPFAELVSDWRDHVLAQAEHIPDAEQQALDWLALNQQFGFKLCEKGADF